MRREYLTVSPSQTKRLGESLAKKILKISLSKKAVIIGLEGDLGGGKTTFIQGFAKGLEIKQKILSPTFVILKKFQVSNWTLRGVGSKFQWFYHIDCYRVEKPKELLPLGFKKIISDPQNIVAIEWVEKVKKILSKKIILVKFKFVDRNKREISINL